MSGTYARRQRRGKPSRPTLHANVGYAACVCRHALSAHVPVMQADDTVLQPCGRCSCPDARGVRL